MPHDDRVLLYDMLKSARRIAEFTQDATWQDIATDAMMQSAVQHQFIIFGEAFVQLNHASPKTAQRVGDVSRIIGFRNILVHRYSSVNLRTVWGVIQRQIPGLVEHLAGMLDEPG